MLKNKKTKKFLIHIIAIFLILAIATLLAMVIIKISYKYSFVKNCYYNCYFNKKEKIWEYRPWGYGTQYTLENRDFPDQKNCLDYCLSQKQIDFIKTENGL